VEPPHSRAVAGRDPGGRRGRLRQEAGQDPAGAARDDHDDADARTDAGADPEPPKPAVTAGDLQVVHFGYDSFQLDDAARAALDANAKLLRDNPGLSVSVDGHCDERGTVEYNQALGQKRAEAVQQYLSDQGIPSTRFRVISYGKERPVDEGHDEAAWARNRRVEFTPR